jgi:hypothetical protein
VFDKILIYANHLLLYNIRHQLLQESFLLSSQVFLPDACLDFFQTVDFLKLVSNYLTSSYPEHPLF